MVWTLYAFTWTINPGSGIAWKVEDVEGTPIKHSVSIWAADNQDDGIASDAGDGNGSTYWSPSTLPCWISMDFGSAKTVGIVKLHSKANGANGVRVKDFTLQYSDNNESWLDQQSFQHTNFDGEETFTITSPSSHRYWRVRVTTKWNTDGNHVRIHELNLFDQNGIYIQDFGYVTPADAGGNTVRVAQCYLKINTDETACDYSKPRCVELNNADNFGGFSHIHELAQKEIWWGIKQKVWGGKV